MKDINFREIYEESKKQYQRHREHYLPIIQNLVDNLIIAFLDPSVYYQNLKKIISLQLKYRTRYFLLGILFFFISFYFIFFFLSFLFLSLYQILSEKIQTHVIISLLLAWIAFLFFFIVIYLSLNYFSKIGQKIPITTKKDRK